MELKLNKHYYIIPCFIIAALLCFAQVRASYYLIRACLAAFLFFVAAAAYKGMITPALLFFLPWAPLLKTAPGAMSAYSIGLVLACVVCLIRKGFSINIYTTIFALLIFALTITVKQIYNDEIYNGYILFIFMLVMFPCITDELRDKATFGQLTVYFALGIISAALSAKRLVSYQKIAQFIDIYTWDRVTRLSGYYGDPNFYSVHISAALSGTILMFFRKKDVQQRLMLMIVMAVLMYCGFLSASKSFIITTACVALACFIKFIVMQEKAVWKALTLVGAGMILAVVAVTGVFDQLWDTVVLRFSQINDIASLTTGRTKIWKAYFEEFVNNGAVVWFGKGCSETLVINRAAHNTLIQMIYQLGFVGIGFLAAWEYNFIRGVVRNKKIKMNFLDAAILLIGIFMPWMGLDMLFFDEFFLIAMYAVAGAMYINIREEISA